MAGITTLKTGSILLFTLFFFSSLHSLNAQCAGDDATITECNKENNQYLDLFAALGPDAVSGGTWTDDDNSGGLNTSTGRLNTWQINRGGIFNYSYTVTGVSGCTDNQSTVTVNLGSYAGRNNDSAVACDDDNSVNLFQFTGANPSPTLDGTWSSSNAPAGSLSGSIFNAAAAGEGTYDFVYTVPAIAGCPSSSSTVQLDVARAPQAGSVSEQPVFCETDDLSAFTDFNLKDLLVNEDDGGSWTDTSNPVTNEISNTTDSRINVQRIRDNFGPGVYTFRYTVQPISPACSPSSVTVTLTIEDVLDFTNATFELTTPVETDDVICEDELPYNAVAQISNDPALTPDGDYQLTYMVNPIPNTGSETITVTFSNGIASFPVNPNFLTGPGDAIIEITEILDPSTQKECPVEQGILSDVLTIAPLPDASDTVITVTEPVCLGEDAFVSLSDAGVTAAIELVDGTYDFTYTLTTPSGTSSNTQTADVSAGNASLTVPSSEINESGDYTLTITQIASTGGCSVTVSISDEFTVSPRPDAATLTVVIENVCEGETVTVTLRDTASPANLEDGVYDITYDITGAISVSGQLLGNIIFAGGTASFELPQSLLENGESTLTVTSLKNSSTDCEAENFTMPADTFIIIKNPDLTNATLSIDPVCEDEAGALTIEVPAGDVLDGNYMITYSLSGANTATDLTAEVNFTSGTGSLTIPFSALPEPGATTITLNAFVNSTAGCEAIGLPIELTFEVFEKPLLDNATASAEDICIEEDASVQLTNSTLADGNYELVYQLSGANSLTDQTVTVTISGGTASFSIAAALLPNTGSTTVTVTQVTDLNTPANCESPVSGLSTSFTVNPNPNFSNASLTSADPVCFGDDVALFITDTSGTLGEGTYEITYSISDSNTATDLTTTVTFSDGTAGFNVPSAQLTNPGSTTVTVTAFENTVTGCTFNDATIFTSFVIVENPDLTDASLAVNDVCLNETPVTATLTAPNLTDGSYAILYSLGGANLGTDVVSTVAVSGRVATFEINPDILTNAGETTVIITSVTNSNSSCTTENLNISGSFTINPLPVLASENLETQAICLGEDETISLVNTGLADGSYDITYSLSGANTSAEITVTVTLAGGEGSFIIDSSLLANTGDTTITISEISNNTTGCSSELSGVSAVFTINPNPDFSNAILTSADPVCFGDDVTLFITDTTGTLADGTYEITYSISGGNSSADQNAEVTIDSGTAGFNVSATVLANTGSTTVTVTEFRNTATNCSSTGSISTSFVIVENPDLTGASLGVIDICLNDTPVIATLSAPNLTDGSYAILYSLGRSNLGTDVVSTVAVSGGIATFEIDPTLLTNAGETNVIITSVTNSNSSCTTENLNISTSFIINPLPVLADDSLTISDICVGENATVTITAANFENGDYTLDYILSGANAGSETILVTFAGGSASFTLTASQLTNAGTTTLTVNSVTNETTGCVSTNPVSSSFEVNPIPALNAGEAIASDICLDENGLVTISNAAGLADGVFTFTYDLSGANTLSAATATVTISGGTGVFEIPASALTQTGATTITITSISSEAGCDSSTLAVSDSFEVLPLPDASGAGLAVSDICIFEDQTASLTGATALADGDYVITFQLSGANQSDPVTQTITVSNGTATFIINASRLTEEGVTTVTLMDIQNFVTLCSAANLNAQPASFAVLDPDPPGISSDGSVFCINDNPKVSDLIDRLNTTTGITVYDSATGTSTIIPSTALVQNETYYISFTDPDSGCESTDRLMVTVDLTGCDSVFIPDGFSPNGDGINDTFEIRNIGFIYPDYTIEIFNRTGNLVFKGNANTPAWDGNSNQNRLGGNTLPNGTYFYIINYNDGQKSPLQGKVYLNR